MATAIGTDRTFFGSTPNKSLFSAQKSQKSVQKLVSPLSSCRQAIETDRRGCGYDGWLLTSPHQMLQLEVRR